MTMPDELSPYGYDGRPYEELLRLLKQRDDEINVWRQRWLEAMRSVSGHGRDSKTGG